MRKEKFEGVLIGLVTCEHGHPFVALSIDGNQLEMTIPAAVVMLEQLEVVLGRLGALDEEDEIPGEAPLKGGATCH